MVSEDLDASLFNEKLEDELDKFNKLKNQKQKEARTIYEEEIKRLKTMQDLKEKEERIIKLNLKMQQDKVFFFFFKNKIICFSVKFYFSIFHENRKSIKKKPKLWRRRNWRNCVL